MIFLTKLIASNQSHEMYSSQERHSISSLDDFGNMSLSVPGEAEPTGPTRVLVGGMD